MRQETMGVLGWQWHQLDHMQTICTSFLTENHTQYLITQFLQAGCSSQRPTNSVKALKVVLTITMANHPLVLSFLDPPPQLEERSYIGSPTPVPAYHPVKPVSQNTKELTVTFRLGASVLWNMALQCTTTTWHTDAIQYHLPPVKPTAKSVI